MILSEIDAGLSIADRISKCFANIKYKNHSYYFEDYNKRIIIDANGNGLMIIDFKICVINPSELNYIERDLDISDGKSNSYFPNFKTMESINPENYFKEFGFKTICDNRIIEKVTDESRRKDEKRKSLKYRIHFNQSKLVKKNVYRVSYIFSLPGMFPMKNGFYSNSISHEKYGHFMSTLEVKHNIRQLSYSITFLRGTKLLKEPKTTIRKKLANEDKKDKKLDMKKEQNPLYVKYSVDVSRPKYNHKIMVEWDIKDRKTNHRS